MKADDRAREDSVVAQKGIHALGEMNNDLEKLIREVFQKMQAEKDLKSAPQEISVSN